MISKGCGRQTSNWTSNTKVGVKDTLDGSRPSEYLRQQILTGVNEDAKILSAKGDPAGAKKQIDEANSSANELLKVIADAEAKRADGLRRASALLLVPPIFLLAFGMAIAWIARGFRKAD
jgi:hypothetical protein